MELLFKREQTSARFLKVAFKLWGKIELDEEETALMKRYNVADWPVIYEDEPKLMRTAWIIMAVVSILAYLLLDIILGGTFLIVVAAVVGIAAGRWFYQKNRETILVSDLIHGRHFTCRTVIDLAHKEAWLEGQVAVLRQVLESCKHWDGTETIPIPVLPKDEAKQLMLRAT